LRAILETHALHVFPRDQDNPGHVEGLWLSGDADIRSLATVLSRAAASAVDCAELWRELPNVMAWVRRACRDYVRCRRIENSRDADELATWVREMEAFNAWACGAVGTLCDYPAVPDGEWERAYRMVDAGLIRPADLARCAREGA